MLTEDGLTSLDIWLVTDDTRLEVRVQQSTKSLDVLTLSQHVQGGPALPNVVRQLVHPVLEEHAKVLLVDSEDLRIGDLLLVLFELLKVRRPVVLQEVDVPLAIRLNTTRGHTPLFLNYNLINECTL